MKIYDFRDYKLFVRAWVNGQELGGRGFYQKIATSIRAHRVTVSQVFQGEKHLTLEQAGELCEFLGLNTYESFYLITLVQKDRAGTQKLKGRFETELERQRTAADQLVGRLQVDSSMNEMVKARFYSNWYYSAIRVLTSIEGYQKVDSISNYLNLNRRTVREAIEFLCQSGLCREEKDGSIRPAPTATYLDPESPFINSHRMNWRMKAMDRFSRLTADELSFSAPLSLSHSDFLNFKNKLHQLIEDLYKIGQSSPSEMFAVMNIDWIKLEGHND